MIDENIIIKSINDAIIKCSPSAKARSIGASVVENTVSLDANTTLDTYTYENGYSVSIKHTIEHEEDYGGYGPVDFEINSIDSVSADGNTYNILNDKSYDFFNYQKDQIISEYGQEGWDFFTKYSDLFGSSDGIMLNSMLRGESTHEDIIKEYGHEVNSFLVDNHERFVNMEKNLSLDNESFVTTRVVDTLHRNDSIGKKIVQDKGHTSTSMNSDEDYYSTFANTHDCWKIFTVNEKGSGVKGAFLGNAINERTYDSDFEREVNYAPNQRFERIVMDEKNKIIIQKPLP